MALVKSQMEKEKEQEKEMEKETERLYASYVSLCPLENRKGMRAAIRDMREDGEKEKEICLMLARAIVDGLAGGNWGMGD